MYYIVVVMFYLQFDLPLLSYQDVLYEETILQILSILKGEIKLAFVVVDILFEVAVVEFGFVADCRSRSTTLNCVRQYHLSMTIVYLEVS